MMELVALWPVFIGARRLACTPLLSSSVLGKKRAGELVGGAVFIFHVM